MFGLIPKDQRFFELLGRLSTTAYDGAVALSSLLDNYGTDRVEKIRHIKDIEHKGDEITHETILRINKSFITPFDREDIHQLVCRLDDVLDFTDAVAARMNLYNIDKITEEAIGLGKVLVKATALAKEAICKLESKKSYGEILKLLIEIHTCENEGDKLEQTGLAKLFEGNSDPSLIIKWKDIYEYLEGATDRVEDVANVIEGIVLKNA